MKACKFDLLSWTGLAIGPRSGSCGFSVIAYHDAALATLVLLQTGRYFDWHLVHEEMRFIEEAMFIPTIFHLIQLEQLHRDLSGARAGAEKNMKAVSADLNLEPSGQVDATNATGKFFDYT